MSNARKPLGRCLDCGERAYAVKDVGKKQRNPEKDIDEEGAHSEFIDVGSVQGEDDVKRSAVSNETENKDAVTSGTSTGGASMGKSRQTGGNKLALRCILDFFKVSGCEKGSLGEKKLKQLKGQNMPLETEML